MAVYTDDFERADEQPATGWTDVVDGVRVVSGELQGVTGGADYFSLGTLDAAASLGADSFVDMVLGTFNDPGNFQQITPAMRNYLWVVGRNRGDGNTTVIADLTDGVDIFLDNTQTWSEGDRLQGTARGTALNIFRNRTRVGGATDATNAAADGFGIGFFGSNSVAANRVESVSVGDLPIQTPVAGTAASGTGTSVTPTAPSGLTDEDLVIVVAHTSDQQALSKSTNGETWTELKQINGGGTTSRLAVWWTRYAGATLNYAVTRGSGGTTTFVANVFRVQALDSSERVAVDVVSTGATGTDASIEHDSVVPTADYALVLYINGVADDNTRTTPAGMGLLFTSNSTSGTPDGGISVMFRDAMAAATGTVTVTQGASDPWASVTISLITETVSASTDVTDTDSVVVSLSENTFAAALIFASDTARVGSSELADVRVLVDAIESFRVSATESPDAIDVSVDALDSIGAVASDVGFVLAAFDAIESLMVADTDNAFVSVLIAAIESLAVRLSDVGAPVVRPATADSTGITIGDGRIDLFVNVSPAESIASAASEFAAILVMVDALDALTVALSERSFVSAIIAALESLTAQLLESSAPVVMPATADSNGVTVSDGRVDVLASVSPSDALVNRVTEAIEIYAEMTVAESLAVVLGDIASVAQLAGDLFTFSVAESIGVRLSESVIGNAAATANEAVSVSASAGGVIDVRVTPADSDAVVLGEVALLAALVNSAESVRFRLSEATDLVVSLAVSESAAVAMSEAMALVISAITSESVALVIDEDATGYGMAHAGDSAAIALSPSVALDVEVGADESVSSGFSEVALLTLLLAATESIVARIGDDVATVEATTPTDTTAVGAGPTAFSAPRSSLWPSPYTPKIRRRF